MWAEFCSHCGQNLGAAWSKHFYWYTSSHFLKICCSAKSRYPLCSQKFTKNSDRNHSKPLSTLTIFDWSLSELGSFKNFFRNLLRIPLPSQPLTKFLLKLRNEKHNALFQFPLFFFFTVQVFRSKFVSGACSKPRNSAQKNSRSFAQSICTHYSSLSGRPDIFLGYGT